MNYPAGVTDADFNYDDEIVFEPCEFCGGTIYKGEEYYRDTESGTAIHIDCHSGYVDKFLRCLKWEVAE